MNKETRRYNIRWMIRRDMPAVLAAEQASFQYPWNEEEFLLRLRKRSCIGMVAEHGDAIAGYMVYEIHKDRLELPKLAVHPDYRHQGCGKALIDKLIQKLSSHRRPHVDILVRETNLPAQHFLASQQFKATTVERQAFPDTDEDGYTMRRLRQQCAPIPYEPVPL